MGDGGVAGGALMREKMRPSGRFAVGELGAMSMVGDEATARKMNEVARPIASEAGQQNFGPRQGAMGETTLHDGGRKPLRVPRQCRQRDRRAERRSQQDGAFEMEMVA